MLMIGSISESCVIKTRSRLMRIEVLAEECGICEAVISSSLSSRIKFTWVVIRVLPYYIWRGVREAYGSGLENRRCVKASVGSNPTLAAN